MNSFFKNSGIYLGAAALNVSIPFLALPIIFRLLPPEQFGQLGVYLALVNVALVIVGFNVHGIVSVVYFRDGADAAPPYIWSALRLAILSATPLVFLSWAFAAFFGDWLGIPGVWVWTVFLIGFMQFIIVLAMAMFQAREEPLYYALLQVGLTFGWAVGSIMLIWGLGMDWTGRAVGQIIAAFIIAMLALIVLRRKQILVSRKKQAPLRKLLRFGLPLVPHALAAAFMAGADRFVLAKVGTVEMAGLYFGAFQICALVSVGAAAVNQAWVPWLYKRLAAPTQEAKREIVRLTYALFAAFFIGGCVLSLASPWLILIIAGDDYLDAIPVMRWLAPAAAFSGMYYFVTNYLFYYQRTEILSAITVAVAALQLILLIWLVPQWGILGAGYATLLAAITYWLAIWIAAQRVCPMPWLSALRERPVS